MKKKKRDLAFDLISRGYGDNYICGEIGTTPSSMKTYRTLYRKVQKGELKIEPVKPKQNGEISKRMQDIFIALETKLDEDILREFKLSSKTLETYKTTYRRHFGLPHRSKVKFNELSFAHQVYLEGKQIDSSNIISKVIDTPKINDIKSRKVTMKIGNKNYIMDVYLDDNLEWIDLNQLLGNMKNEIEFDINDLNIQIHKNYIKSIQVNNSTINLLDINSIPSLGVKLNDHTLINSGVNLLTESTSIFYKIRTILDSIEMIETLLDEFSNTGNSKLKVYEKIEQDILHDLEKNKYQGEKLIEVSNKLVNVLDERRFHKNEFVLKIVLKSMLVDNSSGLQVLKFTKDKLEGILYNLYNKHYSPKADLLEEDWQKEIVDRLK